MPTPTPGAWAYLHPEHNSTPVQQEPLSYGPGVASHAWTGESGDFEPKVLISISPYSHYSDNALSMQSD